MTAQEPLSTAQLAEYAALEAAATRGPWDLVPGYGDDFVGYIHGEYLRGVGNLAFGVGQQADADRAFALRAREMVPALLKSHELLADILADARMEATHNYQVVAPLLVERLDAEVRRSERLLTEVNQLTTELESERAVLAKTVAGYEAALGLAEAEPLTVWRAEVDTIPLGAYLAGEEARAHCEAHYRDNVGSAPTLSWFETAPEDDPTLRMHAAHETAEVPTVYTVVPIAVLAVYEDGEE